jgi:PAS domain S-box-containing protein
MMLLLGFAFGKFLGNSMEHAMLMNSIQETADITYFNVIKHFKAAELLVPKQGGDYTAFTHKMEHLSLGRNIERVKIWNDNMAVVWSDEKELVGKVFTDNRELKKSFSGEIVSEIKKLRQLEDKYKFDHEFEKLLELYIPITFQNHKNISAVFEVYQNLDPLYQNIARHKQIIWIGTFIGFMSLYLMLFGIVWNASRRIDLQTKEIIQSKQDWEETFDSITDMITIHDKDFNIVRANKAAGEMLGLPSLDAINSKCYKHFHGTEVPLQGCPGIKCIESGQSETTEIYDQNANKFLEIRAMPRFDMNNKIVGIIHEVRDITESKMHEREQKAIFNFSAAMRTSQSRSDMVQVILDQLLILLKVDGAALLSSAQVSNEEKVELGRGNWEKWTGDQPPFNNEIREDIINAKKPFIKETATCASALKQTEQINTIGAIACAPLIVHNEKIGTLLIGREKNITEEELRMFTTIADIAANAIRRATLHEKTEQRMQRLTALHSIDMAISASLDLRVTLNVFLDHVTSQLQVDAASVLLLNNNDQILEYAVGRGFRTQVIQDNQLRLGEDQAGVAALERKTIKIPHMAELSDVPPRIKSLAGEGFISYFICPLVSKGQVKGVLEVFNRKKLNPDNEWMDYLEALSLQAAIAVDNATLFDNLQHSNIELIQAYDSTLEGWSRALDMRDKVTEGHTRRVTETTVKIARIMGMSEAELVHVRRGAMLHDIGKMGIPDSILLKPGPLNDEEWEIMRLHPGHACKMLSPIAFLRPALDIPYCHHEKWDGTGYPRRLKGDQIPLSARIFAVVDVWDALRSDRPYRPSWPVEKVLEHIYSMSGTQFDPEVVEEFSKIIKTKKYSEVLF